VRGAIFVQLGPKPPGGSCARRSVSGFGPTGNSWFGRWAIRSGSRSDLAPGGFPANPRNRAAVRDGGGPPRSETLCPIPSRLSRGWRFSSAPPRGAPLRLARPGSIENTIRLRNHPRNNRQKIRSTRNSGGKNRPIGRARLPRSSKPGGRRGHQGRARHTPIAQSISVIGRRTQVGAWPANFGLVARRCTSFVQARGEKKRW